MTFRPIAQLKTGALPAFLAVFILIGSTCASHSYANGTDKAQDIQYMALTLISRHFDACNLGRRYRRNMVEFTRNEIEQSDYVNDRARHAKAIKMSENAWNEAPDKKYACEMLIEKMPLILSKRTLVFIAKW